MSRISADGSRAGAEQVAEKCGFGEKSDPQRLKPNTLPGVMYGLKAVPFRETSFSAAC
jgi:hypothetical protein